MRRLTGVVALILVTVWVTFSEGRANGRLTDADDAWDRGDYPRALNAYLALLDRTPTDDETEAIALQTGELFKTVELTADGGAPRFSPDAGRGQVGVRSGSGRGQVEPARSVSVRFVFFQAYPVRSRVGPCRVGVRSGSDPDPTPNRPRARLRTGNR